MHPIEAFAAREKEEVELQISNQWVLILQASAEFYCKTNPPPFLQNKLAVYTGTVFTSSAL
jgi:hypothetical protein